jgi:hypothetical protein
MVLPVQQFDDDIPVPERPGALQPCETRAKDDDMGCRCHARHVSRNAAERQQEIAHDSIPSAVRPSAASGIPTTKKPTG